MFSFLKFIVFWIVDALPDISNLILVLVGVIMSLPKLAERIEDHKTARYSLAFGCIILGLAGFVISVNQRREATSQMKTLVAETGKLVTSTNTLVTNMNTVVLTVPQISGLNAHVLDLDKKIDAAKGNPQLIASLRAQASEAQEQSSKISKQLVFAMVPGVSNELESTGNQWIAERGNRSGVMLGRFNSIWSDKARPLLVTADSLRQQLLRELPPSAQTSEDASEAATFVRAISAANPDELKTIAGYLRELSNRVALSESHF